MVHQREAIATRAKLPWDIRVVRAILIGIGIFFLVAIIVMLLFVFRCDEMAIAETTSPNGAVKAGVFEADCEGATGGVVTHINLAASSRNFRKTLIRRTVADGEVFAIAGGGYNLKIAWLDDSTLRIICAACKPEHILKKSNRWNNISVRFD